MHGSSYHKNLAHATFKCTNSILSSSVDSMIKDNGGWEGTKGEGDKAQRNK